MLVRHSMAVAMLSCVFLAGSGLAQDGPYADGDGATTEGSRLNNLISTIEAEQFGIGPFVASRDPLNARMLGGSGLDFVIIDMEHNPYDAETLRELIYNLRAADGSFPVTPIVRIPLNGREASQNQWLFKQILDAGAMGIMVPQVNSAEEAQAAVQAMRFPPFVDDEQLEPRGQRGFGGVPGAWGLNTEDYVQKADLWPLDPNGELLLIVQFETAAAIDDMEAILSVPGVGAGFLGPADLHADMGYLGQFGGVPEVAEKIAQAGATAREMGAYLGIIGNASSWEDLADQGFMFISGGDVGLSQALSTDLESLDR